MTKIFLITKLFLIIKFLSFSESVDGWIWTSYTGGINRMISKISPEQSAWISENCGVKQDQSIATGIESGFKIYGGQITGNFEYPWAVGLEIGVDYFKQSGGYHVHVDHGITECTGTLISMQHVLTAQHCFTNKIVNGSQTRYHYGSETTFKAKITIGKGNIDEEYHHVTEEQSRYVLELDYHNNRRTKFDWALVELEDKVPQNLTDIKAVVPICLPATDELVESSDFVEMYGLGGIQATGPDLGVGRMRYINTTINSTHIYGRHGRLYRDIIATEEHLSREGDSGGGITKAVYVSLKNQCKHMLIGITSGRLKNKTIAVDARSFTLNVQNLTGISL